MKGAVTLTINSFKKDIDKSKMFNIKIGLMATEETWKYLLLILNHGKKKSHSFINYGKKMKLVLQSLSKEQK